MRVASECPVIGLESGPPVVPERGSLGTRWCEGDFAPGIRTPTVAGTTVVSESQLPVWRRSARRAPSGS